MTEFVDITMPKLDDGTESSIEKWLKDIGESVEIHEPLIEVSTDKVTIEVAAPATGVISEISKQKGDSIVPGDVLGKISLQTGSSQKQEPKQQPVVAQTKERSKSAQKLSPAVRRLIRMHNVDVTKIQGTGRGQRVTARDVKTYVQNISSESVQVSTLPPPSTTPSFAQVNMPSSIPSYRIPHNKMRIRTAEHMVQSMLKTAPHVTSIFEMDMSAVIQHRKLHKAKFQKLGVNLTFTSYFVSAVVEAIREVPEVNSRWHSDTLEIFNDYNVGIATAVEKGLIVPVLHQTQNMSLLGIATKLQGITQKARNSKLDPQDVRGGTFTITNHGVSGSLIATPIINQPQSAILGIGKMQKRVIVVESNGRENMQICPMVYVTLTIDHRALDGYQANIFLSKFVSVIENWS